MPAAAAPPPLAGAARRTMAGTLLLAALLYTLNSRGSILPSDEIVQAFALDRYSNQWITGPAAVVGIVAIFVPLYYMNVVGARRLYLLGALCLTGGAIGAALARTSWELGLSAVLRSGSSLYAIPGLVLMQRLMPGRPMLGLSSFLTMVYGGQVLAEPVGGLLAYHPSWRALFVIIAAGAAWAFLCGWFLLPDDRPAAPPSQPFDAPGATLLAVWMALLLFLLYRGNYLGWQVSTPVCLAVAGLVVIAVLYVWRQQVAPVPYMDLRAYRVRTIVLAMSCSAFWCAALYGVAVLLSKYLLLRGYQTWKAGWVMLPPSLVLMATMFLASFVARRSRYVWMLRLGLAGMTAAGFWLTRVDLYTSWQWIMTTACIWSVFAGLCLAPIARLTYEGQSAAEVAATGAIKFFHRACGGTVGLLVAGILAERATDWGLDYVRDSLVHGQGALQVMEPVIADHMQMRGSAPPEAAARTAALLGYWVNQHAQIIGFRAALQFCVSMSAVALLIALCIHRRQEGSVLDPER